MRPLRILFVTSMHPSSEYPLRGVIVVRLAEALRQLGHEIEFVPIGSQGGFVRYWQARHTVGCAIRDYRPDLIHVHFGYSGISIPHSRTPLVASFYGDDLNGTVKTAGSITLKSRLGILLSQWTAWRSARCIVVSAGLRDRLWLASSQRKTMVVRDPVDVRLFQPRTREAARRHLRLASDDRLIIFPHDLTQPTKRYGLAVAAVDVLRRSMPDVQLWVVNGRPADEMPWYYAAADAMLVTSEREGGPSSVKEALACGIPVVSVSVGDTQLFSEVPDWMAKADAVPEALAEALHSMLLKTAEAERRSRVPLHLTLDKGARAIEALYHEAIGGRVA